MQERWAAEAGLPRGSQGRTGRDARRVAGDPLGLSHAARLALLHAVSNSRATHGVRRQSRTCHAHPNHPVISVQPDTRSFRSLHRWHLTRWPRRGRAVSPAPTVSGPVRENGAPAIPSLRCLSLPLTEPCCSTSEVRGLRARTRARIPSPAPCLSGPDTILPERSDPVAGGRSAAAKLKGSTAAGFQLRSPPGLSKAAMLCRQRQAVRQSSKFRGNRQATPRQRGTAHANIQTAGGRRIDRAASHRCFSFVDVDAR